MKHSVAQAEDEDETAGQYQEHEADMFEVVAQGQ
jgi:hypothetical protein